MEKPLRLPVIKESILFQQLKKFMICCKETQSLMGSQHNEKKTKIFFHKM